VSYYFLGEYFVVPEAKKSLRIFKLAEVTWGKAFVRLAVVFYSRYSVSDFNYFYVFLPLSSDMKFIQLNSGF